MGRRRVKGPENDECHSSMPTSGVWSGYHSHRNDAVPRDYNYNSVEREIEETVRKSLLSTKPPKPNLFGPWERRVDRDGRVTWCCDEHGEDEDGRGVDYEWRRTVVDNQVRWARARIGAAELPGEREPVTTPANASQFLHPWIKEGPTRRQDLAQLHGSHPSSTT